MDRIELSLPVDLDEENEYTSEYTYRQSGNTGTSHAT